MTSVGEICLAAFVRPDIADETALRTRLHALEAPAGHNVTGQLCLIATILYLNPSAGDDDLASALVTLSTTPGLNSETFNAIVSLALRLEAAPVRRRITPAFVALLFRTDIDPRLHEAVVSVLEDLVAAEPDALPLVDALSLLEAPHLARYRDRLGPVIERRSSGSPISLRDLERLARLETESSKFALYTVAHSDAVDPSIRSAAAKLIPDSTLHSAVREILQGSDRRILVIQNIADAQGDEIIRVVPLVQALLDSSPHLVITLVTGRTYLYGHPRLQLVYIHSQQATSVLSENFDAVVNFVEPSSSHFNHARNLEAVIRPGQNRHPRLWIEARKGSNDFAYQTVAVDGRDVADELGLDRKRVNSVYDSTARLIAALRLPLRTGTSRPLSNTVLGGLVDPRSGRAWDQLVEPNVDHRPIALINPFGGALEMKGYVPDLYPNLVTLMRDLVKQGYFLVLLPGESPWGGEERIRDIVAPLAPEERSQVVVASAPSLDGASVTYDSPNQMTVPARSYTMHQYIHFVRQADLVLAVEGWVIHAAYTMGKQYQMLLLPYSHSVSWRPYACASSQAIMAFPPTPPPPLDERAAHPTLDYTRKRLLVGILPLLGKLAPAGLPTLLVNLSESPDRDLRHAVAAELGRLDAPMAREILHHLLKDSYFRVRALAARSLLDRGWYQPDEADTLRAHAAIGDGGWGEVVRMGAEQVIRTAANDEDQLIRTIAGSVLPQVQVVRRAREQGVTVPGDPASRSGRRRHIIRNVARLVSRRNAVSDEQKPRVAILTPVKNAAPFIERYFANLRALTYPAKLLSIGLLESDSFDGTHEAISRRLPAVRRRYRRVGLWKHDFNYQIPPGLLRWSKSIQVERRSVLARSRNHLLFHMLDDEDWVLWLDVDVIDYPADIIETLLATGRDIVQPHCVLDPGGPTFDCNAWRDHGRYRLDHFRGGEDLIELDAVGGTMLLVRADIHREGLVFPTFPYGLPNPLARDGRGELETEGLGLVARDMGYRCWGMPNLEIIHNRA